LMSNSDGAVPLLQLGSIVHDEMRFRCANERIGLLEEDLFELRGVPPRNGNKVMQLLRVVWTDSRRKRFDTLALARREQSAQVKRRPTPSRFMLPRRKKRLQPLIELLLPVGVVPKHVRLQNIFLPEWKEKSDRVVLGVLRRQYPVQEPVR
jgi:hypothetical protein